MGESGIGVARRGVLTLLLLILLIAPIPLNEMAQASDPHAPPSSEPNWAWLFIVIVMMGSALRRNRSALGLWAVLSAVIGIAMVITGFFAENGSVRFLSGSLAIAVAIVFALLREELAEPRTGARPRSREHVDAASRAAP